ncbi:MAG TPA: hypothetical protein VLK33_01350 [Terriglobales bacterium]|nr:hypothetical protein [Terriglobales bacterium]
MRRLPLCLVLLLIFSAILTAFDNLRPPTAAEKQVLEKYETVINKTLDQFQSDDWDENVDYSVDENAAVGTNTGRPLDVDEMFQRTYRVRNGSERWNRVVGPQMAKLQDEPDMSKKMAIGQALQALTSVEVEVHFNSAVSIDAPPTGNKGYMQVPGAAMAYHATTNPFNHGSAYVLLFGNWQAMKWDAGKTAYPFHFAHPQNTPFIENVVIQIYGADDRIQELLKKIDWNAVNAGITR